jgi:hypothetical protein
MAFTDPPPAAPGRSTVRLERGWAAVLLQIHPGGPVAAVGLFRRDHLEQKRTAGITGDRHRT